MAAKIPRSIRRTMGSETEYTVQRDSPPSLSLSPVLATQVVFENGANDVLLDNGARLYNDMGSVVEYATPECTSAEEVLIHEKAGEQIVTDIAYETVPCSPTGYPVFKRSSYVRISRANDDILEATSAGHHENYATDIDYDQEQEILSYLVTRPLWAGAGIVTPGGFELSQKRNAIDYTSDESKVLEHGSKTPLRFRPDRLEVRSGDGNMSPWAIRTKFAMTSLVLRLIEHGEFPREAIIPTKSSAEVASFMSSRNPLASLYHAGLDTVDHQQLIATAACEFALHRQVPPEEYQAAVDILAICKVFRQSESIVHAAEALAHRVDWAAKLSHIRHQAGIRSLELTDITTERFLNIQHDLLWEALGHATPSKAHYDRLGNTVSQRDIDRARHTPPNTRARKRVALAREQGDIIKYARWGSIEYEDASFIYLATPFPKSPKIKLEYQ